MKTKGGDHETVGNDNVKRPVEQISIMQLYNCMLATKTNFKLPQPTNKINILRTYFMFHSQYDTSLGLEISQTQLTNNEIKRQSRRHKRQEKPQ